MKRIRVINVVIYGAAYNNWEHLTDENVSLETYI